MRLFPVKTIIGSNLDVVQCPWLDTLNRDCDAIGVRPRDIKGCDPTDLAESMLRRVSPKSVSGDEIFGIIEKLKVA